MTIPDDSSDPLEPLEVHAVSVFLEDVEIARVLVVKALTPLDRQVIAAAFAAVFATKVDTIQLC